MRTSSNGATETKQPRVLSVPLLSPTAAEIREHSGPRVPLPSTVTDTLETAWPSLPPQAEPCGENVIVQLRTARSSKTITRADGTTTQLHFSDGAREVDKWNCQIAKVVAIGPLAFRNRTTFETWSEGPWFQVGDFVRVPIYGGDRWEVDIPGRRGETALFVVFRETDVRCKWLGDPLTVKAFT